MVFVQNIYKMKSYSFTGQSVFGLKKNEVNVPSNLYQLVTFKEWQRNYHYFHFTCAVSKILITLVSVHHTVCWYEVCYFCVLSMFRFGRFSVVFVIINK